MAKLPTSLILLSLFIYNFSLSQVVEGDIIKSSMVAHIAGSGVNECACDYVVRYDACANCVGVYQRTKSMVSTFNCCQTDFACQSCNSVEWFDDRQKLESQMKQLKEKSMALYRQREGYAKEIEMHQKKLILLQDEITKNKEEVTKKGNLAKQDTNEIAAIRERDKTDSLGEAKKKEEKLQELITEISSLQEEVKRCQAKIHSESETCRTERVGLDSVSRQIKNIRRDELKISSSLESVIQSIKDACEYKPVKSVKEGKSIQFQIANLNLLKYNVAIRSYTDTSDMGWQALVSNASSFLGNLGLTGFTVPNLGDDKEALKTCEALNALSKEISDLEAAGKTAEATQKKKDNADLITILSCACNSVGDKKSYNDALNSYNKFIIPLGAQMEEVRNYLDLLVKAPDCGNFEQINADKDLILHEFANYYNCSPYNIGSSIAFLHKQKRTALSTIMQKITTDGVESCTVDKGEFDANKKKMDEVDSAISKFQALLPKLSEMYPKYFHYNIPQVQRGENLGFLITIETADS
jgi:hypothetical protein